MRKLKIMKLKKCRCGKNPWVDRTISAWDINWWVACNCGKETKFHDTQNKAIKDWNQNIFYLLSGIKK
jgi:hypothetical protein